MEFSKEVKGARPLVLDTSVVIDGRIADVAETRVIDQPMVVPRFVLQELQSIADSSDKLRRNRGRRGLDILNRLQKSPGIEVRIHDAEIPELAGIREVDQRLVVLAKHLGGKVVTNDYNLNKIARLQGVEVINLNDLANAMKPIVLPGESLTVKLLKRGEEPGQGVGYLDDGTMVVAEQGAYHLGETVRLTVTSVLQTSAGRMIFGRIEGMPSGKSVGNTKAPGHQEARARQRPAAIGLPRMVAPPAIGMTADSGAATGRTRRSGHLRARRCRLRPRLRRHRVSCTSGRRGSRSQCGAGDQRIGLREGPVMILRSAGRIPPDSRRRSAASRNRRRRPWIGLPRLESTARRSA